MLVFISTQLFIIYTNALLFILVATVFSEEFFYCKSDNTQIPQNRVNDGFCDCTDGSDELLTYSCNNSSFICKSDIGSDGYINHLFLNLENHLSFMTCL